MKFKEPFKTGQIYRSKTHPQFDFMIDYISYNRFAEKAYDFNLFSIICWERINGEAFDKFVSEKKGVSSLNELFDKGKNTFPYAWAGEGKPNSIKEMIRKYNMEYTGMSDKKVKIYQDNEAEFSSGFVKD